MDFGKLAPEVNSGRMYAGPGATTMLTAAVSWDRLAAEMRTTAAGYRWVTGSLAGGAWRGPSAASMAAAARLYARWLANAAAKAEQAAAQARAAAAAFEEAHAMTVPPPLVAANRTQLMVLAAANALGRYSPAIAETEARYEEMWARDAAAMYGYARASAAAVMVTPFTSPPGTVDLAGLARQGVAVPQACGTPAGVHAREVMAEGPQLIASAPAVLHQLGSPSGATSSTSGLPPLSQLTSLTVPARSATYALYPMWTAGYAKIGSATGGTAAAGVEPAARRGGAARVGRLSVPSGWFAAASVLRPVTAGVTITRWRTTRGRDGVRMRPITVTPARGAGAVAARRLRPTVIPRSPTVG